MIKIYNQLTNSFSQLYIYIWICNYNMNIRQLFVSRYHEYLLFDAQLWRFVIEDRSHLLEAQFYTPRACFADEGQKYFSKSIFPKSARKLAIRNTRPFRKKQALRIQVADNSRHERYTRTRTTEGWTSPCSEINTSSRDTVEKTDGCFFRL